MSTMLELLALGAAVSFGPCLLHCSAAVLPYIAATAKGWQDSLKSMAIFLSVRIFIYTLLGLAAGAAGRLASVALHEHRELLMMAGGICIACFGLVIMLGYDPGRRMCRRIRHVHNRPGSRTFALAVLAASMAPCASLAAVLAYIALTAESALAGAGYGMAFGIGKALSPLLPLAAAAGLVSKKLSGSPVLYRYVSLACGSLLAFIGVRLVLSSWS